MGRLRRCRIPPWLVLLGAALVLTAPRAGAAGDWSVRAADPVADGVTLSEHVRGDPLRSLVVEVAAPGAAGRVGVVVSGDRVDGGRETVSSMCERAGAVACVNAHFATCPSCGDPSGAVVRDGVLARTRTDDHFGDVAVIHGQLTSDLWPWSLRLRSAPELLSLASPAELSLDGVNVAVADGIVAYTPDFGPRTPAPPGAYEVVVRAPEPLRTGPDVRQPVGLVAAHRAGHATIPPDGMVLSGRGAGADRLQRFVSEHGSHPLELISHTPAGLEQSVAGHPVLLRGGQRQPLDATANRHVVRHPRTVIGWDDHGTVWLVVVDGRQPGSRGIGLADVAAHLQGLGATDAVNLDGGGSSTLVTRCPYALRRCVRNRPSDGRERPVTTALVVHGTFVSPPPPPPPPTTTPPPPPALPAEPPGAVTALEVPPGPAPEGAGGAPAPAATPASAPPPVEPPGPEPAPEPRPSAPVERPPAAGDPSGRPEATESAAAPPAAGGDGARPFLAALAAALVAVELAALGRLRGARRA